MSDKPYRVPPWWSDEAARLVWEDYRVSLVGDATPPLRAGATFYTVLPGREDACEALVGEGLLVRSRTAPFGYRYVSVDHRLRAWAAVGAPVLAPAEDGQPSLAEWVAAAEGSALGRANICARRTEGDLDMFIDCDGSLGGEPHPSADDVPDVFIAINLPGPSYIYAARDEGAFSGKCDSPAALRAALDALAGER